MEESLSAIRQGAVQELASSNAGGGLLVVTVQAPVAVMVLLTPSAMAVAPLPSAVDVFPPPRAISGRAHADGGGVVVGVSTDEGGRVASIRPEPAFGDRRGVVAVGGGRVLEARSDVRGGADARRCGDAAGAGAGLGVGVRAGVAVAMLSLPDVNALAPVPVAMAVALSPKSSVAALARSPIATTARPPSRLNVRHRVGSGSAIETVPMRAASENEPGPDRDRLRGLLS